MALRFRSFFAAMLSVILVGMTAGGCIHDDLKDCELVVRLRYTYNIKDADAFASEVKSVVLYIFDENGVFQGSYTDSAENGFSEDYAVRIPSLPAGRYTLVALGRNKASVGNSGEFVFSDLKPGVSVITDLHERLDRNGDVSDNDMAALYLGEQTIDVKDGRQEAVVSLMKATNRFRIILMPYGGTPSFDIDDYDISITCGTGWLDYKGDKYGEDVVTFKPHSIVLSEAEEETSAVSGALVADITTSRLIVGDKPVLVVTSRESGAEVLRLDLAWFLSLQGIAEHRSEWSNQEYLDRQDAYNITLFIDGNLFIKSKIIVNGWVLSLSDITL